MKRVKEGLIEWLEFELLAEFDCLKHAVFLRRGGVSEGNFASLNISPYVGDSLPHVLENCERMERAFSQDKDLLPCVCGRGVHGKEIALVHESSPREILDVDGLMTNACGIPLMMRHADCQIAFFFDPFKKAIACVHAGWRGSVLNIYRETTQKMSHVFGSKVENLIVCIGPSLEPWVSEFRNYKKELPEPFWEFQVKENYFDFWAISEWQLRQQGIASHHVEIARIGTVENGNDFFSYRRDQITGRNGSCISLL